MYGLRLAWEAQEGDVLRVQVHFAVVTTNRPVHLLDVVGAVAIYAHDHTDVSNRCQRHVCDIAYLRVGNDCAVANPLVSIARTGHVPNLAAARSRCIWAICALLDCTWETYAAC
jgi:hypothetical protein